jgi:hypothetical protein
MNDLSWHSIAQRSMAGGPSCGTLLLRNEFSQSRVCAHVDLTCVHDIYVMPDVISGML